MVLIDFIKDRNIDGNLYLLKDIPVNKGEICRILGIKSIPTVTKRLDYIKNNNIEIDIDSVIPNWIFNNLDIPLLFKVWLLYCNGVEDIRVIIKMMGIADTKESWNKIGKCLICIKENSGTNKIEESGKMHKDDIARKLATIWNKK